ncbi:MAG: hypothetical protein KJN76_02605 [Eudoraea sp.]|nr:hypothetical protein [Eudoraea sp.]
MYTRLHIKKMNQTKGYRNNIEAHSKSGNAHIIASRLPPVWHSQFSICEYLGVVLVWNHY